MALCIGFSKLVIQQHYHYQGHSLDDWTINEYGAVDGMKIDRGN
jgi:hypothetical protein